MGLWGAARRGGKALQVQMLRTHHRCDQPCTPQWKRTSRAGKPSERCVRRKRTLSGGARVGPEAGETSGRWHSTGALHPFAVSSLCTHTAPRARIHTPRK